MKKKLSLITPLYNTPIEYLEDILKDLVNYKDSIEWVVVNDSPENVVLNSFLSKLNKYEFIKIYFNKQNLGIYKSYVVGFLNATGRYSAILDHDDRLNLTEIITYIEEDNTFELLFTNEYKFISEMDITEKYIKPKFDTLSILFYFYTHHITLFQTNIVKQIVSRYNNEFSSIFDISLMLDYIKEFKNGLRNVVQLDSLSYGWRQHENSTSVNIDQKPAAHFERIKKTEEFFEFFGDNTLVSIDHQIPYLMNCYFFTAHDILELPYVNDYKSITNWFNKIEDNKLIKLIGDNLSYSELISIIDLLRRLPLNYLKNMVETPLLLIPKSYNYIFKDNTSYNLHLRNVPFMIQVNKEYVNNNNLCGLILDFNYSFEVNKELNVIILKEGE